MDDDDAMSRLRAMRVAKAAGARIFCGTDSSSVLPFGLHAWELELLCRDAGFTSMEAIVAAPGMRPRRWASRTAPARSRRVNRPTSSRSEADFCRPPPLVTGLVQVDGAIDQAADDVVPLAELKGEEPWNGRAVSTSTTTKVTGRPACTPKPVMVTVASTVRCPRDHAARAGLVGRSRRVSNDAMCSFVQCAASSGNMCPIPAAIWTSASGLTTRK